MPILLYKNTAQNSPPIQYQALQHSPITADSAKPCPAESHRAQIEYLENNALNQSFLLAVAAENNPSGPLHILQQLREKRGEAERRELKEKEAKRKLNKAPGLEEVPIEDPAGYSIHNIFYDILRWYSGQQNYAKIMQAIKVNDAYYTRVLQMSFGEYLTAVLTGEIGIPVPNSAAAALVEEVQRVCSSANTREEVHKVLKPTELALAA